MRFRKSEILLLLTATSKHCIPGAALWMRAEIGLFYSRFPSFLLQFEGISMVNYIALLYKD